MPRYSLSIDSDSGRVVAEDGSLSGRPMPAFPSFAFESRALTALDDGRSLQCVGNPVLSIPPGLPSGWICMVTPQSGPVYFAPLSGVTLNGLTATISRQNVLLNRWLTLSQTAANTYSLSGV